jgi:hypothetical protein
MLMTAEIWCNIKTSVFQILLLMDHYHNTKYIPYYCHITNHIHVPLGTENINTYFQGNGATLVASLKCQPSKKKFWLRHILHLLFFNLKRLGSEKGLYFYSDNEIASW